MTEVTEIIEDNLPATPATGSQFDADGSESSPEGDGKAPLSKREQGLRERGDRHLAEREEARAELAVAQERITRYQRAEVERLAADGMSHPADLFSLSGNDVADYLTEDGEVDAEKVAADVAAVLAERPGLRKTPRGYDPSHGLGGHPNKSEPSSWADLFKI